MDTYVLINILSFTVGALLVYLTAYLNVKGKNKTLVEDNHKLEDEKQKVIAKYRAETEDLIKKHTLDIEKRRFQYEDKRAQFTKYFALIDEFNGRCNKIFVEKFQPIITEFLAGYLEEDQSVKNRAIVKYNENVQVLVFELNEEHLKVKTEQNSIRLISSKPVDQMLDEIELALKRATELSTEMLKVMSTKEFWLDQSIIKPYQEQLTTSGEDLLVKRDALKSQMKLELNEI